MRIRLLPVCLLFSYSFLYGGPSVTIYNQQFGVVRETIPLKLKKGENRVRFSGVSAFLEPDSVILNDSADKVELSVLEQNYRSDPVSSGLLLDLNEGNEIEFFVKGEGQEDRIVKGKVIRSGYVRGSAVPRLSGRQRIPVVGNPAQQPVIEVDGKLQFSLPGEPLFPALADDSILQPTLEWKLHSNEEATLEAELCYLTGGMSWEADYNVVAPVEGNMVDITGWVTMENRCGKTFADAEVQLIAGDVAKLAEKSSGFSSVTHAGGLAFSEAPPQVSQKSFDDFHLYTLPLATTLRDREMKQVEFVKSSGVESTRFYVYDGAFIDPQRYRGSRMENIRHDESYGTQSNPKVWVMREVKNTEENSLGMPLPRGRVRFYRRDEDGKLQFVGEDQIDHTARDETIRLYTGNAFDLVGERTRTHFKRDGNSVDESFEIKVRNRKENEAVEIRIVEKLYRWTNWEIREKSDTFLQTDAQTIEFRIPLKPGEEHVLNYTVHYSWK